MPRQHQQPKAEGQKRHLSGLGEKCAHPTPPPIVGVSRNPSRKPALTEPVRQGERRHRQAAAPRQPATPRGARSAPETPARQPPAPHRRPAPATAQARASPAAGPHRHDHQDHPPRIHGTQHPRHRDRRAHPESPARRKARPAPPKTQARQGKPASGVRPQSGTPARKTGHQYPYRYQTVTGQRETRFSNNHRNVPVRPLSG